MNTKVIYTIILGDYDTLKEPEVVHPEFDYICFTNKKDLVSRAWTIVQVRSNDSINLKRNAARFIIYPFNYLKKYEISLLIGGQVSIHCDIGDFVKNMLPPNKSFSLMRHPKRDCVYEEAQAVLDLKKDTPEVVGRQMEKYRSKGYPEHAGLISSGIMIRRHSDKNVRKHCRLWLREVKRHSQRDQLSFNYILWRYKLIDPFYFQPEVGQKDFIGHYHNFTQEF